MSHTFGAQWVLAILADPVVNVKHLADGGNDLAEDLLLAVCAHALRHVRVASVGHLRGERVHQVGDVVAASRRCGRGLLCGGLGRRLMRSAGGVRHAGAFWFG